MCAHICLFNICIYLLVCNAKSPRPPNKGQKGTTDPGIKTEDIAKDCLLTLVKSRLALGSPGCSFVRSFVTMPKMAQYTG